MVKKVKIWAVKNQEEVRCHLYEIDSQKTFERGTPDNEPAIVVASYYKSYS